MRSAAFVEMSVGARYDAAMPNPKPDPNHARRLAILREMTASQRLEQAFALGARARALFEAGLRKRFPDLSDEDFKRLLFDRLALCHNRRY